MKPSPREEARKARTDLYRQHIFTAAERIFAAQGYETAKVQEIAKLAELSMGTIYAVFPSKRQLFEAILEERGEELLDLVRATTRQHEGAWPTLRALMGAYIGYFADHPDFLRMHLLLGSSWVTGPSVSAPAQREHWQEIHVLQEEIFRRGVAEGIFVDESPSTMAKLFTALDQAILAEWVAGDMRDDAATVEHRLARFTARAFHRRGESAL